MAGVEYLRMNSEFLHGGGARSQSQMAIIVLPVFSCQDHHQGLGEVHQCLCRGWSVYSSIAGIYRCIDLKFGEHLCNLTLIEAI